MLSNIDVDHYLGSVAQTGDSLSSGWGYNRQNQISALWTDLQCIVVKVPGSAPPILCNLGGNICELHSQCSADLPTWRISDFVSYYLHFQWKKMKMTNISYNSITKKVLEMQNIGYKIDKSLRNQIYKIIVIHWISYLPFDLSLSKLALYNKDGMRFFTSL